MSNDSVGKTLTVAFLLCVVCAVLVSMSAVMLKPMQVANKEIDRKKNILAAAGLLKPDVDVKKAFESIETRLVSYESGEYVTDINPASFSQKKAVSDPQTSMVLSSSEDIAGIKRRANIGVVYLAKDDSGQVTHIILPVRGYGLWSTLYGFLALKPDAKTVYGLGFYEHAETPGLGGEVDNPNWKAQWLGKEVFDDKGNPDIKMYKGRVTSETPNGEHKFDALSGATLTSRGVENLLQFWVSELGYGAYLKRVQKMGV